MRVRRVMLDASAYAVAGAAAPVVGLLVTPVLARDLGPHDYGTLDVLNAITALAGSISLLAMIDAAARSYYDYPDHDEASRRSVIATAIRIVAVASLVVLALGEGGVVLVGNEGTLTSGAAAQVALATVPAMTMFYVARETFRLTDRKSWYLGATLLNAVVGAGAGVLLVVALDLGPAGYFLGLAGGSLAGLALIAARERTTLAAPINWRELPAMVRLGAALLPASLFVWALFLLDRTILLAISGAEEVGLYAVANRAATPALLAAQALSVGWIPAALRLHASVSGDEPAVRANVLTAVVAAGCSLALGLTLFAGPVVEFLGGSEYAGAAPAVGPLALAFAANSAAAILVSPLLIARRGALVAGLNGVCAAVNLVLTLALVPAFGLRGAAWATALSFVLLAALYAWAGARIAPAPVPAGRLLVVGAVGAGGLVGLALPATDAGFGLRGVVLAAAMALIARVSWQRRT
jgi:O-antigen/teichoic acid export membrane protein